MVSLYDYIAYLDSYYSKMFQFFLLSKEKGKLNKNIWKKQVLGNNKFFFPGYVRYS